MRAVLVAVVATAAVGGCRCGRPQPELAFEVGAPLEDLPSAGARGLASLVPARAPLLVLVDDPGALLARLREHPAFAAGPPPQVLADLALSRLGAAGRALRQRLNDLSPLPLPTSGFEALVDGPLALAAREGPNGLDLLVVKRLSPAARGSWQLARMLQAVQPSSNEVRAERYRGLPLRKVLIDARQRITWFVLRDVLVAGTNDAWVKQSLDLALAPAGSATTLLSQPGVRDALAEPWGPLAHGPREARAEPAGVAARAPGLTGAVPSASPAPPIALAVVDAATLRTEGQPWGEATLLAAGTRWIRLEVPRRGAPIVVLAPEATAGNPCAGAAVSRFLPRGAPLAVSRSFDVQEAARSLLRLSLEASGDAAVRALAAALEARLVPALGDEAFWFLAGAEVEGGGGVAQHVVGIRLRDPKAFEEALSALLPDLLQAPVTRERDHDAGILCGGDGQALCLVVVRDVLLVANGPAPLRLALAVAGGDGPAARVSPAADACADGVWLDGAGIARTLGRLVGSPGEAAREARARAEAALQVVRGLGTVTLATRREPRGLVRGELAAR